MQVLIMNHFGSLLLVIRLLRLCDGILESERAIEDIGEGFTHRVFLEKVPVVMVALLLTPHAWINHLTIGDLYTLGIDPELGSTISDEYQSGRSESQCLEFLEGKDTYTQIQS